LPDVSLVDRMPALDVVSAQFGGPDALAGFEVVVAQHLFPTTMGLVDALQKNGLPKEKLHLIGKSYSTHERTYSALLADGIDVDKSSRQDNDLAEDAAVRLAGAARRQLQKIFSSVSPSELADPNAQPRFLLFDEGGKLLETLHKEFPQYAKLCIGVEHTDRGMQMLDDLEKSGGTILLPVIDMARSLAKKLFESPAIGESVVFHAELEMQEAGVQPTKKEACVVGYGAVGKATADALRRRGYTVWVHDTDPAALARAQADGCEVPAGSLDQRRAAALAHAHLLVSCTGRTTMTPDEFADLLPDGAVLTNAASGTHELGIHALGDEQLAERTAAESLRSDGIATTMFRGAPVATGPFLAPGKHRHLVFVSEDASHKPRQHLVLRGGAVVNMTRGMPPEIVQLTLGLVLTSVLQAAKAARNGGIKPGRVALGEDEQKTLVATIEADLKNKRLPPLSAPDFRTVASWG
jgi:S-adenosylhomocysteine hydrolase